MTKRDKTFLGWCIGVLVVVLVVVFGPGLWREGKDQMTKSTLQIEDTVVGTGAEAHTGDTVSVHYTGTLTDGTVFDSSVERGVPFELTLGAGMVIQGWEEGIPGMKVGGTRRLIIPPEMGYGNRAVGSIPAGSTLVFDVELLEIK